MPEGGRTSTCLKKKIPNKTETDHNMDDGCLHNRFPSLVICYLYHLWSYLLLLLCPQISVPIQRTRGSKIVRSISNKVVVGISQRDCLSFVHPRVDHSMGHGTRMAVSEEHLIPTIMVFISLLRRLTRGGRRAHTPQRSTTLTQPTTRKQQFPQVPQSIIIYLDE